MSWQVVALIAVTALSAVGLGLALLCVASDADDYLEEQHRER